MARRILASATFGALLLACLAIAPGSSTYVHVATVPAAAGPWLDRFNAWRISTGLAPLTENATWSQGDYNHSVYMVKDNQVTHSENPAYAYYTASGDQAAQNSNIEVSSSTSASDQSAIDWWMAAPFHAMGMMDPRLTTTGFGSYRDSTTSPWKAGFALDVLRGNPFTGGTYPVYFPGNGSTEPLTGYSGNEYPNPLTACPGYSMPTGLPVFIQVGGSTNTSASAGTFTGNGTPLAHCTIDSHNASVGSNLYYRGGVIIIPRSPLQNGVHYVVALTVNNVPYTWAFTVGALTTVPGAPANLTATAGDTTANLAWTAPAYDGGSPITSYTVTPYIGSIAQAPQTVTAPATTALFTGLTDGTTYWFTVAASNTLGKGPAASSYSVTPTSTAAPPARSTSAGTSQYALPNSDGATWQDMDATNLSLSVTPSVDSVAIVSANADLWTASPGYNQDLGIWMSPSTAPAGIIGWKESGGSGGTFSPNAAALQSVVPLTASVTYSFKVRWKTNKPALGVSIFAGAGPLSGGGISPSRLTIQLLPAASVSTAVSTQQYSLGNSDGATWLPIDATNLKATISPSSSGKAVLVANADLWTANAGFNQDLAIFVSVNGGGDRMVAWKESGGSAGTFSPNAAYVQAVYGVSSGSTYVFTVKWKTNKNAPGATIFAGAGPIGSAYSPSRLTAAVVPSTSAWAAASGLQYALGNSDGTTWTAIDPTNLVVSVAPGASETILLGGNADLWTANSGFNQDLGIFVSVNGGADQLVAWKESGGYAGTFSPNAAFVLGVYSVSGGNTYVFTLKWKTNKSGAGATILAGAGPSGGAYSPTSLVGVVLT